MQTLQAMDVSQRSRKPNFHSLARSSDAFFTLDEKIRHQGPCLLACMCMCVLQCHSENEIKASHQANVELMISGFILAMFTNACILYLVPTLYDCIYQYAISGWPNLCYCYTIRHGHWAYCLITFCCYKMTMKTFLEYSV